MKLTSRQMRQRAGKAYADDDELGGDYWSQLATQREEQEEMKADDEYNKLLLVLVLCALALVIVLLKIG